MLNSASNENGAPLQSLAVWREPRFPQDSSPLNVVVLVLDARAVETCLRSKGK